MLRVENLSFSYGHRLILDKINFELGYGQLVSVLGSNGAGKSTLFRCILQLLERYDGRVMIDNEDLKLLKQRERARKIAYIPQEYEGIFNYTVEQVVLMSTTSQSMFKVPKKEEMRHMTEALEKVRISKLKDKGFFELSGGERQLVLIARALAQQSKILIMDEPTSNLDFGNQIYLMQVVKELAETGYLIILSTHNPDFALQYSDRVLILNNSRIIANGEPNEVMTSENLSNIYKNDIFIANIENSNKKTCLLKTDLYK